VTEPTEDSTELSERNKEAEDITQLSARVREQLSDEADEYTQLSARHLVADEDTADATRLSRRAGGGATKATARKAKLPALPPGSLGGAVAERGSFGMPVEEYAPRGVPVAPQAEAERATPVPEDVGVQEPGQARARREAVRHRRLITTAIIVGITAAIMTAAVLGILALLSGQD
jgi:hypothetical protein